jgi:hypothetical protein
VENRIALALPVLSIDKLDSDTPTFSDSSSKTFFFDPLQHQDLLLFPSP